MNKSTVLNRKSSQTTVEEELENRQEVVEETMKGNYLIAIDGTQKFWRDKRWDPECLERHVGKEKEPQYYVYVLEAVLIFDNGLTIPLWSEFLKFEEYQSDEGKQDCERKAFKRMAEELKRKFPKLKIAVALDGLYACGPIIAICHKYWTNPKCTCGA